MGGSVVELLKISSDINIICLVVHDNIREWSYPMDRHIDEQIFSETAMLRECFLRWKSRFQSTRTDIILLFLDNTYYIILFWY